SISAVLRLVLGRGPHLQPPGLHGLGELLLHSRQPLFALDGLPEGIDVGHDLVPLLLLFGRQAPALGLGGVEDLASLFDKGRALATQFQGLHELVLLLGREKPPSPGGFACNLILATLRCASPVPGAGATPQGFAPARPCFFRRAAPGRTRQPPGSAHSAQGSAAPRWLPVPYRGPCPLGIDRAGDDT